MKSLITWATIVLIGSFIIAFTEWSHNYCIIFIGLAGIFGGGLCLLINTISLSISTYKCHQKKKDQ